MATEIDPATVARKLGLRTSELARIYDPEGRPMEPAFRVARRFKLVTAHLRPLSQSGRGMDRGIVKLLARWTVRRWTD